MTRQERRLVEALVGGRVVWGGEERKPAGVRVRVAKGVGRGKREGERGKAGVAVGR